MNLVAELPTGDKIAVAADPVTRETSVPTCRNCICSRPCFRAISRQRERHGGVLRQILAKDTAQGPTSEDVFRKIRDSVRDEGGDETAQTDAVYKHMFQKGYIVDVPWYLVDDEHVDPQHREAHSKAKKEYFEQRERERQLRLRKADFADRFARVLQYLHLV